MQFLFVTFATKLLNILEEVMVPFIVSSKFVLLFGEEKFVWAIQMSRDSVCCVVTIRFRVRIPAAIHIQALTGP
jgi:hypothetical protein